MISVFAFFTLSFLVGGCLVARAAYRTWRLATLLDRTGVIVKGHITGRSAFIPTAAPRGGRPEYFVQFSYAYSGKEYSGQSLVDKDAYESWPDGWEVDVVCAPTDPARTQLASASAHPSEVSIAGYGFISICCFAATLLFFILLTRNALH